MPGIHQRGLDFCDRTPAPVLVERKDPRRSRVGDDLGKLMLSVEHGNRNAHTTGSKNRGMDDQGFGSIGELPKDAAARFDHSVSEERRDRPVPRVQLCEREPLAMKDEGVALGVKLSGP
jgi:hypothetical protein